MHRVDASGMKLLVCSSAIPVMLSHLHSNQSSYSYYAVSSAISLSHQYSNYFIYTLINEVVPTIMSQNTMFMKVSIIFCKMCHYLFSWLEIYTNGKALSRLPREFAQMQIKEISSEKKKKGEAISMVSIVKNTKILEVKHTIYFK